MKIDQKEYLLMQPGYPEVRESDKFYFGLANDVLRSVEQTKLAERIGEKTLKDVVLACIGYYQDVIVDGGLWRSFCTLHEELYGHSLPFYEKGDNYIDSELNGEDVRFMVWYVVECAVAGGIDPFDADIKEFADIVFAKFEECYDFAPNADDYRMMDEIDIYDESQIKETYDYSYWLFWNSYLMRHAAREAMADNLQKGKQIVAQYRNPEVAEPKLVELCQDTMHEYPTGPLALYIHEWLKAIVNNESPFKKSAPAREYDFLERLHGQRRYRQQK